MTSLTRSLPERKVSIFLLICKDILLTKHSIFSLYAGDALKQSELLSHLTPVEKNCVLQTTAASNSDDLEEFARYAGMHACASATVRVNQ